MRVGVPAEMQGADQKAEQILEAIEEELRHPDIGSSKRIADASRSICLSTLRDFISEVERHLDGNDWDWEIMDIMENEDGAVILGLPTHGVHIKFMWAVETEGFGLWNEETEMSDSVYHMRFDVEAQPAVPAQTASDFGITEGAPQPEQERPRHRLDRFMDDFFGNRF
jgi:hypothetical protein